MLTDVAAEEFLGADCCDLLFNVCDLMAAGSALVDGDCA